MKNRIVTRDIPKYIAQMLRNNRVEVLLRPTFEPWVSEYGWIKRLWHRYILSKCLDLIRHQFYEDVKGNFKRHPLHDHHVDKGFNIWKRITL